MTSDTDDNLGFSADYDQPIRYIQRTHDWYGALGYDNPYRYAHYAAVPFTPLEMPLSEARATLLTTAAPYQPDKGDQGSKSAYNAAAKFYEVYSGEMSKEHDLRVSHVAVDRANLSDDSNCWFPMPALQRAVAGGRIGELTRRFHGVPTNRSQRHTLEVDAPEILQRCLEDAANVAILVPNCPICHQSMSLIARELEAAGVATVVMGAAKDIVEYCGVPRFLFSDVPLGNAAGRPYDVTSQDATLELALRVLEGAPAPRTTLQSPLKWNGSPTWHIDFMNLAALSAQEIADVRDKNDRVNEIAQAVRENTLAAKG